jgi:hypothetical protein
MTETPHAAAQACRNCGRILEGPFCAECGQAERDGHPPSVAHFFHDLVHEFVHVDGTIFRTLKALFLQPGKLTEEYWAGHVVAWVRPIRLFLVIAAIHLLVSTGVGPLNFIVRLNRAANGNLNFGVYTNTSQFSNQTGTPVSEEQQRVFFEKFEKTYDAIRYSSVLVFALASWLLYRRYQPHFVNHLIAGLHFYSFWYSLAVLASFVVRWQPQLSALNLLSAVYLFLALRRLFPERWYLRLIRTVVLFAILLITELALGMIAGGWVTFRLRS